MKSFSFIVSIIVLYTSLIIYPNTVMGFGGCDTNCQSCHTLSIKEAQDLLQGLLQGSDKKLVVKNIEVSPSKGLWEVTFAIDNQSIIGYIDFAKVNFINGNIIRFDTKRDLTRDRLIDLSYANSEKIDVKRIPLSDAVIMGNPKAKKKIIVFTDPDCPYCAKLHQEITALMKERSDITFFIKMFPLRSIHPDSYRKSKIIVCEKSVDVLEKAYKKEPLPDISCDTNVLDETIKLAEQLGITGTPAIILPDGRIIKSFLSAYDINRLISKDQESIKTTKK